MPGSAQHLLQQLRESRVAGGPRQAGHAVAEVSGPRDAVTHPARKPVWVQG